MDNPKHPPLPPHPPPLLPLPATDNQEAGSEASNEEAYPIEVEVHGLKGKIYLNCSDADIIPARYLEKADQSHIIKRIAWIFRAATDGRTVTLSKWSKVDIRFRGVFKTLKKVPQFLKGLYEDDGGILVVSASKVDFGEAAKAQGQVVYALLDDIMNMVNITREAEDYRSCFFLRPRILSCRPEYWTGYREKYRDTPLTAGSISLDYYPESGIPRAVVPISTTSDQQIPLKSALEGKFKLLLAQLLVHVHRLSPPGDKIPDQEAFLIGLHGSRIHILRGVFPGEKTSKLWCGRHNASSPEPQNANNLMTNLNERFYTKLNLGRFLEQAEWNQLSNPDNEINPRVFQVLGSREYDLWIKEEFSAVLRLLVGLLEYLMSGQARCGIMQDVFDRYPFDEDAELESDDGNDTEKVAKEQEIVEEEEKKLEDVERQKREEDKARANIHEAMRSSVNDQIGGFQDFRQPWWDWVWKDGPNDGCPKDDDTDVIFRGP